MGNGLWAWVRRLGRAGVALSAPPFSKCRASRWLSLALGICGLGLIAIPDPASADPAAAKVVTAALVSPSSAWTYYGSGTTHTTGIAAPTSTPPEIKALAKTLGADRIGTGAGQVTTAEFTRNVYDYVRNNIAVEFRFGLGKGARGALIDLSGTPFDQAELMKKLLAEGGVSSSYKVGAVTLTPQEFGLWSGFIKNLNQTNQTFSIDARAACQFLADGGIPATVNGASSCTSLTGDLTSLVMGHVWLLVGSDLYDPTFKKHTLKTGVDLPAAMGCGTEASPTCGSGATTATMTGATTGTLSGAPTIKTLNEGALATQLQTYATTLQSAIEAGNPDAPVEDIVGGKAVDLTYAPNPSTSLPYAGGGTAQYTWSGDIPDKFRTTFRLQVTTYDATFYADELTGRRLNLTTTTDSNGMYVWVRLDRAELATGYASSPPIISVDHPYSANSGGYADETLSFAVDGWPSNKATVVLALGDAGPSKAKAAADLEAVSPEDADYLEPGVGGTPQAAQFVVQETQGTRLIGEITKTSILQHHIMGFVADPSGALHLSTTASIQSRKNDSTDRDAAFRTYTLLGSTLEGSAAEQANDAFIARSTAIDFHYANYAGATFLEIAPSNLSAVSSNLLNIPLYQTMATGGSTLIVPKHFADYTLVMQNGAVTRIDTGSFLAYKAGEEGYWGGGKGGGADPNALDPAKTALNSIKQTPTLLRDAFSADLATGNLTLKPAPDLVTGAGAFPYSLSLQRTYSSNAGADELGVSGWGALPSPYSGPDEAIYGRIGGGWTHNFQIFARIGNDGLVGLGRERAVDGTAAIAALVTIANQSRSPTFSSRLSSIMTAYWMSRQFIGNTINVTAPPATATFVRRANGTFGAPAGSNERMVQTGTRNGPFIAAGNDNDWYSIPRYTFTGFAWSYGNITLAYTRSGGDVITFVPSRWSDATGLTFSGGSGSGGPIYEPVFVAQSWQFPDGMKVSFNYATVDPWYAHPGGSAFYVPRKALKLTSVSNSLGRSLTFTTLTGPTASYAGFLLTRVTDETGRHADYALTCTNNAYVSCESLSVTTPDGGISRYEYTPDTSSPLPTNYTRPAYRLRRWYTPLNGTTPFMTFVYDDVSRLKAVVDPLGRQTRYYAATISAGELLKRGEIVDPLNAESATLFDDDNRPLKTIDPLNRATTYAYDISGRLVLKTLPEGNAEARTYDARSNVLTVTLKPKPGSGLSDIVTTTTYVEGPTVVTCSNPVVCNSPASEDGPRTDVTDVTNYSWNTTTGLPTQILRPADSAGVRPQIDYSYSSYTANGSTFSLPTSKVEKISSSISVTTAYAWNSSNKYVLQTATVDSGGLALATGFTFDTVGNLTAVDGPRSDVTDVANYVWDANRRLTFDIQPDPDAGGSLLRPETRYTYDADGQLVQVDKGRGTTATGSDFASLQTTTYVYDIIGNKVRETTPAGVTQFAYDAANRATCMAVRMNPATYGSLPSDACTLGTQGANGPDRITKTVYDLAGQTISTIRGLGSPEQQTYATYTYSANGKQATILDARNNLSTLQYDGFDRLCRLSFPVATVGQNQSNTPSVACRISATLAYDSGTSGDFEEYRYDQASNRSWSRRRDGKVIHYTYDALNRETLKDIPDTTSDDVYTAYDLMNRPLSLRYASTSGSGVIMVYDKAGRLTTEESFGRAMTFLYDDASNRIRVTWPDTTYAQYTYDALSRMKTVGENGATSGLGLLATFTYDDLGRRTNLARGNGAATTYSYDTADRLTALVQNPTGTTYDQTYGVTWSPASQALVRTASNALYKWTTPASGTSSKAYDGLNRDAAIVTAGGYDTRGNLTGDGSRTFTYDVENRLITVGGSASMSLTYDPKGRLRQTVAGSTTTQFLYDGDRLSAEYTTGGTVLRRYVHGPGVDEPLVWYEGSNTSDARWLHQDRQGSVVAWSNTSGAVTTGNVYRYGPWGEPDDSWASGASRFRYTGQIALPEVKLYHYNARVYDPAIGRFLQTDPIGYEADVNLYAYVGGDPIGRNDPTGTSDVCVVPIGSMIATACVGVDGNGDRNTKDEDLSFGQVESLARDFRGFILKNAGASLAANGKEVTGEGEEEDKAFVRAVSQFVGTAAKQEGGEFASQWRGLSSIEVRQSWSSYVRWAAASGPDGMGGRGIVISGNYQPENGNYFSSPSNLARILIHESLHTGMNDAEAFWENWVVHQPIDTRARGYLKKYRLDGGGCVAAGGFPAC